MKPGAIALTVTPRLRFRLCFREQYYADGSAVAVRGGIELDSVIAINPMVAGADGRAQLHQFELVTPDRVWVLGAEAAVDGV